MWIMKRHFNRQLTIIGNRRSPEPFRHGAVRPLPTNGCFCVRNAACADPRFLVLTCFYQFFFNRTTAPAFSLSFSCVLSSCAWMASSIRSCSEGEMPAGWGRPSPSWLLVGPAVLLLVVALPVTLLRIVLALLRILLVLAVLLVLVLIVLVIFIVLVVFVVLILLVLIVEQFLDVGVVEFGLRIVGVQAQRVLVAFERFGVFLLPELRVPRL